MTAEILQVSIEPATEAELIAIVQAWITEDAEYDVSERISSEEMLERLQAVVEYRPPQIPISDERLREIVTANAPNAPHRSEKIEPAKTETPQPPAELAPLSASGHLIYEQSHWFVKRCSKCGNFNLNECCGEKTKRVSAVWFDGSCVTAYGRQAAGLESVRRPEPPKPIEQTLAEAPWWGLFSGAGELEDGGIKMYIENFLPEGITLICGLPKEGKSYLALSIAKSLTTGQPLFGRPGYEVPEPVPVLYLAAEVSDRAFKRRLEQFGITNDKTRFMCRTLSKGPRLDLSDPDLQAFVRAVKPIIILDTTIRFNNSSDEDSATENQKLVEAIFYLRSIGARAIVGLHHSRKDLKEGEPTLEKAVRGSGDMAAMCDCVWVLVRNERLYQNNRGPNEVDVVGWGRDFNAVPMRLALTKKAPKDLPKTTITFAPGIVSCIDETGDLAWVDNREIAATAVEKLEQFVREQPAITLRQLATETGLSYEDVRDTLNERGWAKKRGGAKGKNPWTCSQAVQQVVQADLDSNLD